MMRKKTILAAFAAGVFLAAFAGSAPAQAQGMDCGGPETMFKRPDSWKTENVFRGRGVMRNVKEAVIFAVEGLYGNQCGELNLKTIVLRQVALSIDTNVPQNLWRNMFLVLDDNGNLKADFDEKRYPLVFEGNSLAARNIDVRLPYNEKKNFIVIADFLEIRDKDRVAPELKYGSIEIEPLEIKPDHGPYAYLVFPERIEHWRGNRAPMLFFDWQSPFSNKSAVFPKRGSPQEEFEFKVFYSDEDGDRPSRAEVWIDENANGEFEAAERFAMSDAGPNDTFRELHPFVFKRTFAGFQMESLKFRFYFADADIPAVKGNAAVSSIGIDQTTVFELRFDRNVAVNVGDVRASGYLPGEIVPLKIGVVVYWQGAYEIDWQSFRRKINPRHFVLKGLSVGGRRVFSDEYNIEEAVIFFEAPAVKAEKRYTLEFPDISFVAKVDGRTGKIAVPKAEIPIVLKPRIEGPFVNHLAVRVGEPIMYRVRSVRLADAPRPKELEKLTFKPFAEVRREIKTAKNGILVVEDVIFTLTLFEVAGDYQIPAFKFPSGNLAGFTVKLLPSEGVGKLTLPYTEKSLRVVPKGQLPRFGEAMLLVGALTLVAFLRRPLWAGLRRISRFRYGRTWQDEVGKAYRMMRESLRDAGTNPSREKLASLYNRLRFYLIVIADPTGSGKFIGADARTLRKTLEGSVDISLLDAFTELEDYLMSSNVEARTGEILAKLDQTTQAMYAQLN